MKNNEAFCFIVHIKLWSHVLMIELRNDCIVKMNTTMLAANCFVCVHNIFRALSGRLAENLNHLRAAVM